MSKWVAFALSVVVVVLDQLSKYWAVHHLSLYQSIQVAPMLNWMLAYNTGAAFSFLSQAGDWHRWFFIVLSTGISIAIVIWMIRLPRIARWQLMALGLILGGAVGNLVDRFRLGYVIDFIDVHYAQYHWPAFNLADSAICVGAVLLLLDLFQSEHTLHPKQR